jgi:hypothetical protein
LNRVELKFWVGLSKNEKYQARIEGGLGESIPKKRGESGFKVEML